MNEARRIGVFGGTFDPIHETHLALARAAIEQARLDTVLFVVSATPPHKRHLVRAQAEDRFAMLSAALAALNDAHFQASRIEIDRSGPSFTADTLRALHEQYPGAELFLVIGADALVDLPRWHDPAGILRSSKLLVAPRAGFNPADVPELAGRYQLLDFPELTTASTEVRACAAAGESLAGVVPAAAADYLRAKKLYHLGLPEDEVHHYLQALRPRLKEKRMRHVLGVAEYAQRIAAHAGLDAAKLTRAALLHDLCRNLSGEELLKRAEAYGLTPSERERKKPMLLHGPVAAEEAKRDFGIDDPEVYEAIYWHTTGIPGLLPLGRALMIADFSEASREYPEAGRAREVFEAEGLDAALRYVGEEKVYHFTKKAAASDGRTHAFLEWLRAGLPELHAERLDDTE